MQKHYTSFLKKYASTANEFLLHASRQTDNQISGHTFESPDKRYSPIISTICGLKK